MLLRKALTELLDHYLDVVKTWGGWNPEKEREVMQARAALRLSPVKSDYDPLTLLCRMQDLLWWAHYATDTSAMGSGHRARGRTLADEMIRIYGERRYLPGPPEASVEQTMEDCPDGHHNWGDIFCRRCGRAVVQRG